MTEDDHSFYISREECIRDPSCTSTGVRFDTLMTQSNKYTFKGYSCTWRYKNRIMTKTSLGPSVHSPCSQFTCTCYPGSKRKWSSPNFQIIHGKPLTGGINSSLSGSCMLPRPGKRGRPPLPPPLPGNGPGPTGSNLARGGAPIGGKKPSPPQGPRSPPSPPGLRSLNMG